jgi:hypothetical protein
VVGNAVLSLLSSIVGGVLVLAGQTLARRHEDRRLWLTRLYEAAGDLATSYLQEAARVNDSRRSGRVAKDEVDTSTYIVDRQKALGRFRTLPWASTVETERRAMGAAIQDVWATWDDPDEEFQRAYDDARTAVDVALRDAQSSLRMTGRIGRPAREGDRP